MRRIPTPTSMKTALNCSTTGSAIPLNSRTWRPTPSTPMSLPGCGNAVSTTRSNTRGPPLPLRTNHHPPRRRGNPRIPGNEIEAPHERNINDHTVTHRQHSSGLDPPGLRGDDGRSADALNPGTPWPATDALSRSMPDPAAVPPPRPDRFIGIFYFLTHGRDMEKLPNDLAKILPQDPDLLKKPDSPLWGPKGPYYWGEPLYGYYDSRDPWVIRRHANLLTDAGVDVVIFDTTNRKTYPEVYMEICKVWSQILKEGGRAPRLCFMVNTKAGDTADELYRDLYQPGLLSRTVVSMAGQAAVDLRSQAGQRRGEAVLHAPQGALALQHGEHAQRLVLGSHPSAALQLRRRPSQARAGQRVRRAEPAQDSPANLST